MGLLDDLQLPPKRIRLCNLGMLYNTLEPDDKQRLLDAVNNPQWSATGLAKALEAKGLSVGHQSITRHRRKDCSCSKI